MLQYLLSVLLLNYVMLLILSLLVHSVFAHMRKSVGMGVLRFKMKAANLTNTEGFMRKPDPFFELSRRIDSAGGATWYVLSFSQLTSGSNESHSLCKGTMCIDPMWSRTA
jgi:hypothetical protein